MLKPFCDFCNNQIGENQFSISVTQNVIKGKGIGLWSSGDGKDMCEDCFDKLSSALNCKLEKES